MLLLIQKSTAENCDTIDSEIGSQAVSLPIQKLTAMVESFPALIYPFFLGVYNVYDVKKRMKGDRY